MSKISSCFYLLIAFCVLLPIFGPALAMIDGDKYTESEKIGFAFYKLSDQQPNFARWIAQSDLYQEADSRGKSEIMNHELYRLETGFFSFNPDEDLFQLTVPVRVRKKDEPELIAGEKTHEFLIIESAIYEGFILPVDIYNKKIAIFLHGLQDSITLKLSPDRYKAITRELGLVTETQTDQAHVRIMVRPFRVDAEPVTIAHDRHEPMVGEIGHLSLWAGKEADHFIWGYRAPWYISADHKEILDLQR